MESFPEGLFVDIGQYIERAVNWLLDNCAGFFDGLSDGILWLLKNIEKFFMWVPWWVFVILIFVAGWHFCNLKRGIFYAALMFLIGCFGLWTMMVYTLSIVFVSVIFSLLIGLPLGIVMAKSITFSKINKPILDFMQTMPSMVYLIPAAMLFHLGKVPAVFATTIYALPPMIRLTYLGLINVNKEVIEAGHSFGSTGWQMLKKIEFPQALSTIMTGINQTTMMAMSMVVICSMIGAKGIGQEVLTALNRLEIGRGFQAGLAIVFLAIILDRIIQGAAKKLNKDRQGKDK